MKVTVTLCLVLICSLSQTTTAVAETIDCASGDVQCLIAAIHQANADPRKTTIRVAGGTYLLTSVDNVTDGANGLPSVVSPVTIKGASSDATVERASSAPPFRILHVGPTGQLTLDGITLTGGSTGGLSDEDGGALLIRGGSVTIINSSLERNRAVDSGGAISNRQGTLTIVDSTIVGNGSSTSAGGGISNAAGLVTLTRTVLDRNGAIGGGGLSSGGGEVRISESLFTNNGGEFGGGGLIVSDGTVEIDRTTFAANRASKGRGTAIYVSSPHAVVRDSAVVEHLTTVQSQGGALFNVGSVHVSNTTFARNTLFPGTSDCPWPTVINEGTITLANSTFAENGSAEGGTCLSQVPVVEGRSGSTTRLQNTIIVHNPEDVHMLDCLGVITSLGNNFIGNPAGCNITLQLSDLTGDAELGTFTDDGTPGNPHYSPLPLSPVIDAGNNSACPKTDQIGQPRKPKCDIGAVEFR